MSKKTVPSTIKLCDLCGTEKDVFYHCLLCDKDICYACGDKVSTEFMHNWSYGSRCRVCGECLTTKKNNLLLAMLYEMAAFRLQYDSMQQMIEEKAKKLTESIKLEAAARGLKL